MFLSVLRLLSLACSQLQHFAVATSIAEHLLPRVEHFSKSTLVTVALSKLHVLPSVVLFPML